MGTADEFGHLSKNGRPILFISDVRTANHRKMDDEENDMRIKEDHDSQARWHHKIKPIKSMLKFRLPYHPGKTKYLKGDIHLPVWGPQSTTETRLIVSPDCS